MHFSSWIRFRYIFLGRMAQSVKLAGGGILLLLDFVTVESVIFTGLGIKINYVLTE